MQIPENFGDKIIQIFGGKGKLWLDNLPGHLDACIAKWHLTKCSFPEDLSINLICFAQSPDFGQVALKTGVPHRELFTEMHALSLYGGRNICRCYAADEALGAMLIERIIPGDDLTVIQKSSDRIRIAADLITKLPIAVEDVQGLPAYADWIERAFSRARRENKVGAKMLCYIQKAEALFDEINALECPRVLLHGDLHHKNMLLTLDGGWKAIDPKGVIGVPCLEAARFIENEIDMVQSQDRLDCLDEMATVFSAGFGEHKRRIAAAAFILHVLSICWHFEDALLPEEIAQLINDCEIYCTYMNGF